MFGLDLEIETKSIDISMPIQVSLGDDLFFISSSRFVFVDFVLGLILGDKSCTPILNGIFLF